MKKTILLFLITFAAVACQNEVISAFFKINKDLEKTIATEEKAIDSLQNLQETNREAMLEMRFIRISLNEYKTQKEAIISELESDYENLETELNPDSELLKNGSLSELNKEASKIIKIVNTKLPEKVDQKSLDVKDIEGFPIIAVIAKLNTQHQALVKKLHQFLEIKN
ncbi:hypothetical protein [Mesonia aquimarina]|uniref:hypothetical protein n=1 Tax=Mesonia aquimarina TaxID=1504967 RepID=UPI000EF62C2B|nr:hypothetical protein [Mesonia aquimarina]